MQPKPAHLTAQFAAQFADPSVVAAYATRPPYPAQVFDALAALLAPGPVRVLELGCGTGDLTFGLAARVAQVDALEPAAAMLEAARERGRGAVTNVRFIHAAAEAFTPEPEAGYALVVAAESLHWMEWSIVLPKVARALRPGGVLAIVLDRRLAELPWADEERELIATCSTNRDYRAYDLVAELSARGLFRELGRQTCTEAGFEQSVADYVESFHSRNGFSRDRMSAQAVARFGAALRALVLAAAPDGVVRARIESRLVWGLPG